MRPMNLGLLCETNMVTLESIHKYDLDIEPDDIEVSDTVTVVWEIT